MWGEHLCVTRKRIISEFLKDVTFLNNQKKLGDKGFIQPSILREKTTYG